MIISTIREEYAQSTLPTRPSSSVVITVIKGSMFGRSLISELFSKLLNCGIFSFNLFKIRKLGTLNIMIDMMKQFLFIILITL